MKIWTGRAAAERHISLLYGDETQDVAVRLLKKGLPTLTKEGPLDWPWIESGQEVGYQVYIRMNHGGWKDPEIDRVHAYAVDGDDIEMPGPLDWHATPDFVVSRSATRWQAYWLVADCPVDQWRADQLALAAHYGGDRNVANPATLLRLAGTLNLKTDERIPYILQEPE